MSRRGLEAKCSNVRVRVRYVMCRNRLIAEAVPLWCQEHDESVVAAVHRQKPLMVNVSNGLCVQLIAQQALPAR